LAADHAQGISSLLSDKKISTRKLAAGDSIALSGGVSLFVLSPNKTAITHSEGDEKDVNEESLVFRLTFGAFSMLFTADAGFTAEQRILSGGYEIKSSVLKVGHHGSRHSTSEQFLEMVKPELALISAGARNRFGLPSSRTLDILASRKIQLYRTDRDGTIELVSDGKSWRVATPYRQE
jgi:competence protein ComEC